MFRRSRCSTAATSYRTCTGCEVAHGLDRLESGHARTAAFSRVPRSKRGRRTTAEAASPTKGTCPASKRRSFNGIRSVEQGARSRISHPVAGGQGTDEGPEAVECRDARHLPRLIPLGGTPRLTRELDKHWRTTGFGHAGRPSAFARGRCARTWLLVRIACNT